MTSGTTNVGGIPIPSASPFFLAVVALHVLLGLVCGVIGIVAMLARKAPGRHPTLGTVYYWSLSAVFATATILAVIRWAEDYHLFFLGALSFAAASLGRMALRRHWNHWTTYHIPGMGLSYVLMLTAFYVDNGKNLPLWNKLPEIAFWLLPGAIGIPIILYELLRHPLAMLEGPTAHPSYINASSRTSR